METEKMLHFIDEVLMDGINQSDEWSEIAMNNPLIKKAEAETQRIMDNLKLDAELEGALDDSIADQVLCYTEAAFLHGMWAMQAIQYASNNPYEVSRHVMARMQAQNKAKV